MGLLCAGLVVAGCGDTSKDSGSSAAAGQGGATAGGAGNNGKGGGKGGDASGGNGAGTAGAGGAVAGSGGAGSGGAAGSAGANAGGGGGGDDCRVTACAGGLTCVPDDGVCTGAGSTSCVDLSTVTCVDRPVCGCDRTIYESNCAALEVGVFVGHTSFCEAPDGWAACNNTYCDNATEFCDLRIHYGPSQAPPCNAGPGYRSGVCHPLPAACPAEPTCDCISGEPFIECQGGSNCNVINGAVGRSCLSGCYG